jgi:crotonobetainyl-CoA:carnitine CoA-transferase CaiB-like acyl-CoA transferase
MHEALNSYGQFLAQPHVAESGAVAWTNHPHVPQAIPLPNLIGRAPFSNDDARSVSPSKGEHSEAILKEHGYEADEIKHLSAGGAVLLAG